MAVTLAAQLSIRKDSAFFLHELLTKAKASGEMPSIGCLKITQSLKVKLLLMLFLVSGQWTESMMKLTQKKGCTF